MLTHDHGISGHEIQLMDPRKVEKYLFLVCEHEDCLENRVFHKQGPYPTYKDLLSLHTSLFITAGGKDPETCLKIPSNVLIFF